MKRVLLIIAFIAGSTAYSQTVTDSIQKPLFMNSDTLLPLKMDFAYYSKNYDKVFGEFNFTYDANNFGQRNVYVGYGDVLYYQGNSTYIMQMPNAIHNLNFSRGMDVVGGLKNLSSLFNSEKDYSVKQP
jgi:hypothetical protein